MPDGDLVHSQLSRIYQKPYQMLCEGKLDRQECAWFVMKAFLQDIKNNYGVLSVKLAKHMGEILDKASENTRANSSVDWMAWNLKLERVARQATVPHYVKELILRASKGILHEIRYNRTVDASNLSEAVVERSFQEEYKAKFEQRIPLSSNHHADVDNATVTERVEAIRPDILPEIRKWAKKAVADEDVKNLRRSSRKKVKKIDLDEDLL